MIVEKERAAISGWIPLAILLVALRSRPATLSYGPLIPPVSSAGPSSGYVRCHRRRDRPAGGLFTVNPNEGRVLQLFGAYIGTVKQPGLRWANPFYSKHRISLRVRNFESSHLKVNDIEGNPNRDRRGRRLARRRYR